MSKSDSLPNLLTKSPRMAEEKPWEQLVSIGKFNETNTSPKPGRRREKKNYKTKAFPNIKQKSQQIKTK